MNILHLSDLHFGSNQIAHLESDLLSGLLSLVSHIDDEELFVVLSGDITFQGISRGYDQATRFFDIVLSRTKVKPKNILLCPGNHDLNNNHSWPLKNFDSFSYSLRKDDVFTYSNKNIAIYTKDNFLIVGLNSLYKLDHRYGMVDVNKLSDILRFTESIEGMVKIAFLHHHLINQFETDISVLRNAYDLLYLLDTYKFSLVFHGHQHCNQFMPIGQSKIILCGVRTLNFITKGYITGANHYNITNNSITINNYTYLKDINVHGSIGGFHKIDTKEIFR